MQTATVTVRETYDLSSKVGQCGVIGIHSPGWNIIKNMWNGLGVNYRKVRIGTCDVNLACASLLPLDPLGIGTGTGKVSPQDIFNPILYKAVSNESFDNVVQRMKTIASQDTDGALLPGGSLDYYSLGANSTYQDRIYYSMLATSGWRKAHPQQGLRMSGLRPIFYEMLNSYGGTVRSDVMSSDPYTIYGADMEPGVNSTFADDVPIGVGTDHKRLAYNVRGRSVPMPAFTLHNSIGSTDPEIPPVYCGIILIPPAKSTAMYFRMTVSWTITFEGLCPLSEYASLSTLGNIQSSSYTSNYGTTSKDAETTTDLVDTFGGLDIEKVM